MILAIDYGQKEIGLAIGDTKLKIAYPYKILKNDKHLFSKIKKIIIEKNIKKIIVGWPIGLRGSITLQTIKTKNFIESLKKEIKIPVEYFDERLTSKMADRLLKKVKNQKNHDIAATILLRDYLTKTEKGL